MSNRVIIFDTTLRDGEQSPGATMNLQEKLRMARQLESLGVDVIEAGFPASSVGDFEAVHAIANAVTDVQVAALARCNKNDIDRAWQALNGARNPRIHVFLATSPIHMEYKLRKTPDQVVEMAVAAVRHAAKYTNNVEFSAEDASRSNPDFLVRVFTEVINAGATTINVPDTVGYAQPDEYGKLIKYVIENTPNSHKAVFSVHCHDDLGLAVANSLSAIQNGARQAEVTLCGIGERAGNASLEEIVMAMKVRPDVYGVDCGIQNEQLYPACRLLSLIIGRPIAANKAIVGSNAFAHESGIHQDGMLKNRETYEIMTPQSIGRKSTDLVITTWFLMLAAYNFGNIQIISLPHPAISVQPAASDLFALNMEQFWRAAFAGVSQVFLINNVITGILFLIGLAVSSIWAAVFAFVGSIIAICTALILGGGSTAIIAGLFQFSAVLTAIGLGTTFYNPNWRVVCYTFLGTVFTVVAQGALNVLLNVYGIPTLTFPFVVAAWIFLLPNIDLLPKNYQS